MMNNLFLKDEYYKIVGAAMKVHSQLGYGFLEEVYQEALEIQLRQDEIPFEAQKPLHIFYNGVKLQKHYIADFFCFDKIVVEIKATKYLPDEFYAQTINYMKATNTKLAILINFGATSLQHKRIVL